MNKIFKVAAALVFVSLSSSGFAQVSAMATTGHDLRSNAGSMPAGWDGGTDLCRFCHTPHNSNALAPLWDRNASATPSFTVYASGTMDQTMPQPTGVSNGCLSCHDGVTSFDSLTGYTTTPGVNTMTTEYAGSPAIVGSDLSNDHPIGVSVAVSEMNTTGIITGAGVRLFGVGDDTVECASCHDPHSVANTYFLRLDPTAGTLCSACHTK